MTAITAVGSVLTPVKSWWATTAQPWLTSDWTHWGFMAIVALFALSCAALYGVKRERDERVLNGVKVEGHLESARVLPEWRLSDTSVERDILEIVLAMKYRNNSTSPRGPQITSLALQRKEGWRWRPIPFHFQGRAPIYNVALTRLSPGYIASEQVPIHGTTPGGQEVFGNNPLRLELTIAIPGQEDVILRVPLCLPPTPSEAPALLQVSP